MVMESSSLLILIGFPIVAGLIALIFAAIMAFRVVGADKGNEAMTEIGDAIRIGASAFFAPGIPGPAPTGSDRYHRIRGAGLHLVYP